MSLSHYPNLVVPSLPDGVGGEVALILLAAGSSSRMGQSKQLLPIDGKPLLLKAVEAAVGAESGKTIVVLGSGEEDHRKIIQHLPVDIISNPEWKKGMGTSLRMGLNHALNKIPGLGAVIILVCDQPFLTPHHLMALIEKYKATNKPIVASAYANTTGVPALFDRSLFQKLKAVEDGQGAKKIIRDETKQVVSVEFPEGSVDLDTRQDVDAFLNRPGSAQSSDA
jgi:molybdenum cofactor cytidylyltransferase